jgi:3-methylcrotonyl-CoA carboxylase alpha subunit
VLSWRVGEGDNGYANNNTNGIRSNNSTNTLTITFGTQHIEAQVFHHPEGLDDVAHVFAPQGATRITVVDALAHAGEVQEAGGRLTAPMPGKVVSFAVKSGDKVKAGQALALMEAMKMEHTIAAPADGEVLELLYAPGDQVAEGEELLKLKV